MSENGLEILNKKNLLLNIKDTSISRCDHRLVGKQHQNSFVSITTRKVVVLELVHTDACAHMELKSFSGSLYFATFMDDASRKL